MLFTGEDINLFPLDLFLSGWLTTAITSCWDLIQISRLGIEYSGGPQNIILPRHQLLIIRLPIDVEKFHLLLPLGLIQYLLYFSKDIWYPLLLWQILLKFFYRSCRAIHQMEEKMNLDLLWHLHGLHLTLRYKQILPPK